MLNVHIKEIIIIVIIYLFIIQILRLFILSRIKSKNTKKKIKVSKDLYINNNYVTKDIENKNLFLEDIAEEIKTNNSSSNFIDNNDVTEEIRNNSSGNFRMKKDILIIHSNVTI